ncbi:hypothetical protein D3C80_1573820 [compost metagenome]
MAGKCIGGCGADCPGPDLRCRIGGGLVAFQKGSDAGCIGGKTEAGIAVGDIEDRSRRMCQRSSISIEEIRRIERGRCAQFESGACAMRDHPIGTKRHAFEARYVEGCGRQYVFQQRLCIAFQRKGFRLAEA